MYVCVYIRCTTWTSSEHQVTRSSVDARVLSGDDGKLYVDGGEVVPLSWRTTRHTGRRLRARRSKMKMYHLWAQKQQLSAVYRGGG